MIKEGIALFKYYDESGEIYPLGPSAAFSSKIQSLYNFPSVILQYPGISPPHARTCFQKSTEVFIHSRM